MVRKDIFPYIYNKVYHNRAIILALLFLLQGITVEAFVSRTRNQNRPVLTKQQKKTCRETIKKLKSEGYEAWGINADIAAVVEHHYSEMMSKGNGATVIESRGSGAVIEQAIRQATTRALSQIARLKQTEVNTTTLTEIETTTDRGNQRLAQSTQSTSRLQLAGQEPSATLVRRSPDGHYEALLLYVVDIQ